MLDLTVDQALPLLENVPPIAHKLRTLKEVGLGYIELGQSATTLSGGEAQRVKLARELSKRGTGRTLYILDEPTTGLHFEDVKKLLDVLGKLVDQGNTVLVIEHNLDVVRTADHVIDLGPEGGEGGGRIVAQGTPEEVARMPGSHTGAVPGRGAWLGGQRPPSRLKWGLSPSSPRGDSPTNPWHCGASTTVVAGRSVAPEPQSWICRQLVRLECRCKLYAI